MYEIDIERTNLLINTVIAATAVIATLVSLLALARQLRHQNEIESKRVEQEYIRDLLRLLDRPLDLSHSNVIEVEYLRATEPSTVAGPDSLHHARPDLMAGVRQAYLDFTNIASTIITVLPACRRSRGIKPSDDLTYDTLRGFVAELVSAYARLCRTYGNAAELVKRRPPDFYADDDYAEVAQLVINARHAASQVLAGLYV